MKLLNERQFKQIVRKMPTALKPDFNAKKAFMFGIMVNDQNEIQFEQISSNKDIYHMLDEENTELIDQVKNYDLITIQTCGWAAAIDYENEENNEIPPSEHPDKQRVCLLVTANTNSQIGSSILFQSNPYNPEFDWGNAQGQLNDAILNFISLAQ